MRSTKSIFFILIIFCSSNISAQDSLSHGKLSFSGYVDVYAVSYSDSIKATAYQKYTTVSPRSNQFGLNIAMLTAKYAAKNMRGVVTLQYGDIPLSSWSISYNAIQEANAGARIAKGLWFDFGFFRTHVGTEALLPKENYTSSVAIMTFFEPYYEAGLRVNYNPSKKLSFYVYGLNGYGIYQDNNSKKSAGVLATYIFNDRFNIGYSNYYGDDSQDGTGPHTRFLNNVFLNFKGKKIKITAGVDLVTQQHSAISDSSKTATAAGGMLIVSYNAAKKFRVYTRGEFLNDANGILSGTFTDNTNQTTGLKLFGLTLGAEYKPSKNSYIRLEGRYLDANNKQEIFYKNNANTNSRLEAMLNMGFWFE